ncbi:hypothetical protein [Sphingomonas colocasiae]|uniref:Sensor histidine kinase n=1 Tax=Sphingomonas colocasiae TaxID=1848973 RepID=A0ABS7PXW5_9SPHN|nr:hypothetical protein [Sphingomonas colocasiae]MBY8825182.1 hypothetical protein [Sphingomonas colocasiae]
MAGWRKFFAKAVGDTKRPRLAVQKLRGRLADASPEAVFDELASNQIFRAAIAPSLTPKTLAQVRGSSRLKPQGFVKDLIWTSYVAAAFPDQIVRFCEYERVFDDAYILGNNKKCLQTLDELERNLGLSLWLISRRISILQRSGSNESGDYIDTLVEGAGSTLESWLIYMMGHRADPNVTPPAYLQAATRSLNASNMPESVRTYAQYHVLNMPPRTVDHASAILAVSESGTLVDRYIALLDALQLTACLKGENAEHRIAAAQAVAVLAPHIRDDRLQMLADILTGASTRLLGRLETGAADAYTLGDYSAAVDACVKIVRTEPSRTAMFGLVARSTLRVSERPALPATIDQIIDWMATAHVFREDEGIAVTGLLREALIGAHRGLSMSIRALFAGRVIDPSDTNLDAQLEALNSPKLTPLQLRVVPVDDSHALLDEAVGIFPGSAALLLQREVLSFGRRELDPTLAMRLPHERASLYSARALVRMSRYEEAIACLQPFDDHPVAMIAIDAVRELFNAFASSGNIHDALRTVARAYRRNPLLHEIFPLEPLLDTVENQTEGPPFDQLPLSICYHVYNRYNQDKRISAQADAAEEFALSRGADLPSKIVHAEVGEDLDLFTTYLSEVCSPPVLDKFITIEDVNDAEQERLEICRILAERDATARQRYQEEIQEITRRRVVRDRFNQVERTKIYVDTEGVKRQAETNLRDNFHRYTTALSDESHSTERLERFRQVQRLVSEIHVDGVQIHFPDLPGSERDILFERLVHDAMRLLISSQEYGLEAYLSTRVRHGTMGNQLRSAFEMNSLITQRDGDIYQADTFWVQALELWHMPDQSQWLSERLSRFSEEVDSAIAELVRKRVQVRSEETPDGLFVFHQTNFDTFQIQTDIRSETNFDEFMDKVIDRFWKVLDTSLVTVRNYIEGDFLDTIQSITDNFQRDITAEFIRYNFSLLNDAIAKARTAVAVNIANVAGWFTLALDMERPDYEFGIAVEVARESIRVCHPSLDIKVERSDDVSFECRGRSLESLVYILFTALDNAVEHCGYADVAPDLLLETKLEGGWLECTLINTCAPIDCVETENTKLAARRERLENIVTVQDLATTEGGSGYAKIIRILRHDLLAKHSLEFGYRSDTKYAVTIGIDAKAIVK